MHLQTADRLVFVGLLVVALLTSWGAPSLAEMRHISISVKQQGAASLPPDAVLEVELLDVSKADAQSVQIAAQRLEVRALPVSLELSYDSAAIDDRMTYVIAARLLSGDEVVLRTTMAYPVLTRGASENAAVVLERTRICAA